MFSLPPPLTKITVFLLLQATLLCIVVAFAWVVFRFVGPLLGVYELEASFADGPNIGI